MLRWWSCSLRRRSDPPQSPFLGRCLQPCMRSGWFRFCSVWFPHQFWHQLYQPSFENWLLLRLSLMEFSTLSALARGSRKGKRGKLRQESRYSIALPLRDYDTTATNLNANRERSGLQFKTQIRSPNHASIHLFTQPWPVSVWCQLTPSHTHHAIPSLQLHRWWNDCSCITSWPWSTTDLKKMNIIKQFNDDFLTVSSNLLQSFSWDRKSEIFLENYPNRLDKMEAMNMPENTEVEILRSTSLQKENSGVYEHTWCVPFSWQWSCRFHELCNTLHKGCQLELVKPETVIQTLWTMKLNSGPTEFVFVCNSSFVKQDCARLRSIRFYYSPALGNTGPTVSSM